MFFSTIITVYHLNILDLGACYVIYGNLGGWNWDIYLSPDNAGFFISCEIESSWSVEWFCWITRITRTPDLDEFINSSFMTVSSGFFSYLPFSENKGRQYSIHTLYTKTLVCKTHSQLFKLDIFLKMNSSF